MSLAVASVLFFLLLLVLAAALFVPLIVPTLVVIGVSAAVALFASRRWPVRIAIVVVLCAVISFAPRVTSFADGDPNEVHTTIHARTPVGPNERVRIDTDTEYVSFRSHNDPPRWGMRNDWGIGVIPLDMIQEKPEWAVLGARVGASTSGESRVVLRVRTSENRGVMDVEAEVLDGGRVTATYTHRVRKSYPLEHFSAHGKFQDGDWRPILLWLTQSVPWVPHRRLVAGDYHPLNDFVKAAIYPAAITPDGKPLEPVAENLPDSGKLRVVPATFAVEKLVDAGEIPDNTFRCDRESDGRAFTVTAGWGAFIRWKDPGQPEAVLPTSRVDGRDLEPKSVLCDPYGPRNEFWFATYSEGRVHLWRYAVDFDKRALRVVDWLRADPPPEVRAKFDAMLPRRLQIASVGKREALLYLMTDKMPGGTWIPVGGYRIVMKME